MTTLLILIGILAFCAYMMVLAQTQSIHEFDEYETMRPTHPQNQHYDYEREIYEQGLLAGHLMTKTGTFDRKELSEMSAEWVVSRQELNLMA